MGIEYYVVDHARREMFDLGKGGWMRLDRSVKSFSDEAALTKEIIECWCDSPDFTNPKELAYAKHVADRLCLWLSGRNTSKVVIMCDGGAEYDDCAEYEITGTRYNLSKSPPR